MSYFHEIKRKLFHISGLLYVAGLYYLPRRDFLIIVSVFLLLEGALEAARLSIPAVNARLQSIFPGLMRESEAHGPSGVLWLALGALTTAMILQPRRLAMAALLYVVLGDAAASLAGMKLGGPHWPGSSRRFSGSLACFLVCVLVGALFLRPVYGWDGIVASALAATLAEHLPVNDNISIPVAAAVAMILCYHL